MKTCVSYSHCFECKNNDRLLVFRLNKLEQSNMTRNHPFVCKFDRENERKRKFLKSRLV